MTREEILELIGDPRQFVHAHDAYGRSAAYLSEHWGELLASYPGEYVAVHEGAVVAHAPSLHELMRSLDSQSIPRGRTAVRFIDDSDTVLLLPCH